MTDKELITQVLKDGKPHHVLEIIQRCKPGAVNWALRTRVSEIREELKHKGFTVSTVLDKTDGMAIYQITKIQQELAI